LYRFGLLGITQAKRAIKTLNEGDYIVAESIIETVKNRLGFNIIEVKRGDERVASF
jgi:acyl-CoA thioesterase